MCERYIDQLPLTRPQLALNPGMCPDRELNWQPFGLWNNAQSTEPPQSGQKTVKRWDPEKKKISRVPWWSCDWKPWTEPVPPGPCEEWRALSGEAKWSRLYTELVVKSGLTSRLLP